MNRHEEEISLGQPTRKNRNHQKTQNNRRQKHVVTDRMPDWMQEFLANTGIDREFDPSQLSPTQFSALEFAERLYHSERAGLIRVTFDPETDMEPRAELTDLGRATLQRNEF